MQFFKKIYVKYTVLMSLILIGGLTKMEITHQNKGFDDGSAVFIFTIAIPFIVWGLGIWERKKQLKGKITFKQGFMEGWKITLAFAIFSPLIFIVYYTLVNPQIVEWVRHGSHDPTWLVITRDMVLQVVSTIIIGVPTSAIL